MKYSISKKVSEVLAKPFGELIDEQDAETPGDDLEELLFGLLLGQSFAALPVTFSEWNSVFEFLNERGKLKVLPWALLLMSEGEDDSLGHKVLAYLIEIVRTKKFPGNPTQLLAVAEAMEVMVDHYRDLVMDSDDDEFGMRAADLFYELTEHLKNLPLSPDVQYLSNGTEK